MNQAERRLFLIRKLLDEDRQYRGMNIPAGAQEQKRLLRSLMNVRAPMAADETFLAVQDDYLRRELDARGVVRLSDLRPLCGDLYLWQGDITRLQCGAIVNAANAGMTGCYIPCHACIDNCIHTYAGVQLRRDCAEIMAAQGSAEPTGRAKITRAYNLPCDYVLHTVGPIVNGRVTSEDERRAAWRAERRLLLHLHGRVPLSERARGGDRRGDRAAVQIGDREQSEGNFQCFQGYGPGNL